jgi:type IV fimbrial biogenesis protein FimT
MGWVYKSAALDYQQGRVEMLEAPNKPNLVSGPKSIEGFSLIEVMVIVAITAILFAIAAPTFGEYTTNTRVRAAAEALQSDLVLARNEALKRNQRVTLTYDLTTTPPLSLIQTTNPGAGAPIDVRRRDLTEESGLVSTPSNILVTFDSLGRVTTGAIALEMSKPSKSTCETAGGKVRCINVLLTATGTSRMCDPKLTYATNTRGC